MDVRIARVRPLESCVGVLVRVRLAQRYAQWTRVLAVCVVDMRVGMRQRLVLHTRLTAAPRTNGASAQYAPERNRRVAEGMRVEDDTMASSHVDASP